MTPAQRKFVELEKQRKAFQESFDAAIQELALEIGVGGHFQDDEGIAYKIVTPIGEWTKYRTIGYIRTAREGEKAGSWSKKDAKESGYDV